MVASWPDGKLYEIAELTVGKWRAQKEEDDSNQHQHKAETFWQGTHCKTHHTLKVFVKQDRHVLYALYEQGRQILQVRPSAFPTEEMARELLVGIAKKFAQDEIGKHKLKEYRNTEMKKAGVKAKQQKKKQAKPEIAA